MDSNEFRQAAKASIDEIADYYDTLEKREVVSTVEPGYLRKILPAEAPLEGEAWKDIQKDIEAKILPGITHWQHPNFHAFFSCPASFPSILGELYSAAFSGACFNWICSPAVTELETIVLDWVAKLQGLPESYLSTGPTRGGGVIQGSASEAVLTSMVAAREKYLRETIPADLEGEAREEAMWLKRSKMVALASATTHSSAKKAALILGVRFVTIPVRKEDNYALTGAGLAQALADCRAKGLQPFHLTTTFGTTDTCAVDDLGAVVATLEAAAPPGPGELWVHLDGAFAGSALVLPEVQAQLGVHHLARLHSYNFNMHKWLLTNFDASCLFVRDRSWFVQALTVSQAVYGNAASDGGLVTDYREWQIPLGRRFRSLKIWFVLRAYGARGLQAYLRRTIQQGEQFAGWVRARPDLFEVLAGPSFTLTVFRMAAGSGGGADQNARTSALCERINRSGKLWVTSTILDGQFAIRFMTANNSTQIENVKNAFDWIMEMADEVTKEMP